jgi:hypothetical protein
MALIPGLFNSSSPPSALIKPSFANAITRIGPNGYSTLFALTGMMKETIATQVKHGYFSKTMVFPALVTNGVQAAAATTITVNASATSSGNVFEDGSTGGTANILPGNIFQVNSTGEHIVVRSVLNATQFTCTRGAGVTAAANTASTDYLWLVGNAFEEGSTRPAAQALLAVETDNYCQIFRNTWAVTETMRSTLMQAGDTNVAETQAECMQFHGRDIEAALFFGQKLVGQQNGQPFYKMDGIVSNLSQNASSNITTLGSTTNYTQLETALDPIFNTRTDVSASNERVAFVGGTALRVLNNIGRLNGTYYLIDGQTSFGLQFHTLKLTRGTIQLIQHPLLNTNTAWAAMAVVVDLPTFDLAYLRKTQQKTFNMEGDGDANDNGVDAVGGTLTTQLTALFKNPAANAQLLGFTAPAQG